MLAARVRSSDGTAVRSAAWQSRWGSPRMLPLSLSARRFLVLAVAAALVASVVPACSGAARARRPGTRRHLHQRAPLRQRRHRRRRVRGGHRARRHRPERLVDRPLQRRTPAAPSSNDSGGGDIAAGTVVTDQSVGFGTVVINYPTDGLQNGGNDGLALRNASGTVIELLSWEGVLTAGSGPAAGLVSDDIGVVRERHRDPDRRIPRRASTWFPAPTPGCRTSTNTMGAPNPGTGHRWDHHPGARERAGDGRLRQRRR